MAAFGKQLKAAGAAPSGKGMLGKGKPAPQARAPAPAAPPRTQRTQRAASSRATACPSRTLDSLLFCIACASRAHSVPSKSQDDDEDDEDDDDDDDDGFKMMQGMDDDDEARVPVGMAREVNIPHVTEPPHTILSSR